MSPNGKASQGLAVISVVLAMVTDSHHDPASEEESEFFHATAVTGTENILVFSSRGS